MPRAVVPRLDAAALVRVTGLYLLSRLLVLAVAALSHAAVLQGLFSHRARSWVERFGVWDANWYLSIADRGYAYDPTGQSSAGFYPLYPLLIRAGTRLGCDDRLTGYAISLAALYAGCLGLWRLTARETRSAAVAERAVLFLLFCPGAMWFGMIYTESLFLVTTVGCLLAARRGRWLAAGLWGMAAALTRTPGLLLAGFLFLEAAQQWWELPGARSRRWLKRAALAVAGPVVGQASYLVFLQIRFGDWRAQQKTMAAGWGGTPRRPWEALVDQWHTLDRVYTAVSMPLLGIVVALALIGLFTLKRVSYAALALALAALYVAATPGDAMTRYLCTTVPAYLVLAQLAERSRLLETTVLAFSVATMTILTALCANGYKII
ncbi:MAG: hypothetical protein INR65_07740 [Gluconacetobacter diazotrophicus]|nr:hypothetical protein [Gluconacetobacter diazotrophicus]